MFSSTQHGARSDARPPASPKAARQPEHQAQAEGDTQVARDVTPAAEEYNQFMVCGTLFECPSQYAPIKPIGKGAYGVVCSARNLATNEKVAIKKITGVFDHAVEAKRALREVQLLRHLRHENVVAIRDLVPPPSRAAFRDVYIAYELMDTDLHQIIRSPQPLSGEHVSYFVYQVLRGLKYIHSAGVLHRDLKPSNLLVNANCDLKICDFGLARTSAEQAMLTEYVVTRWYRAPELLLSCQEYTAAIDVWSVGCILAELLGRRPLFPGKDYVHQLNLICKVLGSPSEEQMAFVTSDKAKRYLRGLPRCPPTDLTQLWPGADKQAVDLAARMLAFDPGARISVEEALAHPFLAALHDPSDEPGCRRPFHFAHDGELTGDEVRDLMYEEVLQLHPELRSAEAASREPAAGDAAAADTGDLTRTLSSAARQLQSSVHL